MNPDNALHLPVREKMVASYSEQILFGVYGLAFFTLGLVMAVRTVGHHRSALVSRMRLLALFGLMHGVFEWMIMFGASIQFPKFTTSVAAFSFLPLFMFAFWNGRTMIRFGITISVTLAIGWIVALSQITSPPALELIARYCIGVPAAISAGIAFVVDRSFRHRSGQPSNALMIASAGFLAYGATQLVSAPVTIPGLPFIETGRFMEVTGIPVFAIRAAVAVVISSAALMLMTEFEAIIRRDLESQLQRAKDLAEQRNDELSTALARNEHLATHDHLTGVANRRGVENYLMAQSADGSGIAMLHIDLDDFKQVNDTLGHASGDQLLQYIATALKQNVRPGDFVARVGGDEFIVIGRFENNEAHLHKLGERLIRILREPISIDGRSCRCNVSVGIAYDKGPEFDVDQLLLHADTALYRAKRNGKNRVEFFSKGLQIELIRKKSLTDDLFAGVESSAFFPVYQLQFDANSLEVAGVEALARWQHPKRGILAPADFLELADELNLISQIDQEILLQAHRDFVSWKMRGITIPKLSVNISSKRLQDGGVINALEDMTFTPGTVSFELLESIFFDDPCEQMTTNIKKLKDMGIQIEIDDFGTGHASVMALMRLSPHRLKIDRALTAPITDSKSQRQLVKSIIDIGLSQGISVTAEGVETLEHAEILRDLGCDTLQGYALARPMGASDLIPYLSEEVWRQRA